jgi:hypothetical protein
VHIYNLTAKRNTRSFFTYHICLFVLLDSRASSFQLFSFIVFVFSPFFISELRIKALRTTHEQRHTHKTKKKAAGPHRPGGAGGSGSTKDQGGCRLEQPAVEQAPAAAAVPMCACRTKGATTCAF